MQPETNEKTPTTPVNQWLGGVAAVLALLLVGFGIWALGAAILFAWALFDDPGSIGHFARYFLETTRLGAHLPEVGEGLAHFVSWVAVILLLLVLGKLGTWAVEAGARLLQARGAGGR